MSVYDREHKGVCGIGTSVCTFWREKEIETQAVWPDAVMKSRLKMFYCLIVPKKCKFWLLSQDNFLQKTFKSSQIWSHWTQAIYLPTCLSKKKRERENESYLKCVSLPWLWSRQKVVFGSRFRVNATAAAAGVDENRSGRKQGCDVCVTLKWSRCDVGVTFMGRRCDVGVTLKWSRWNLGVTFM